MSPLRRSWSCDMNGYSWHPVLRVIPENGPQYDLDIKQQFLDGWGPTRVRLRYRQEDTSRQDINRKEHQTVHGFRQEITMTLHMIDMREHRPLTNIINAFMAPNDTVQLSLDGGFTFREVTLDRPPSPSPIRNKTLVGALLEFRMRAAELVDSLPVLTEGW